MFVLNIYLYKCNFICFTNFDEQKKQTNGRKKETQKKEINERRNSNEHLLFVRNRQNSTYTSKNK